MTHSKCEKFYIPPPKKMQTKKETRLHQKKISLGHDAEIWDLWVRNPDAFDAKYTSRSKANADSAELIRQENDRTFMNIEPPIQPNNFSTITGGLLFDMRPFQTFIPSQILNFAT